MQAFLMFSLAAAATWLGVLIIRRWATRRRMLDRPNDRSLHTTPTPTGGGLAIVAVVMLGLLLHVSGDSDAPAAVVFTFAGAALLIAAISWLDDMRPLSVRVRLCVHVLAVSAAICAYGAWSWRIDLPWAGPLDAGWLATVAAFFWLLGTTNAYNFMDGVDGMAAAVAVVAGLGWFALAACCGAGTLGTLGLLLAAASGGFLLHNRPPARIFMGDVGSAFLGFSFGSLTLIGAMIDPRLAVGGALLVWPFIFDTFLTFTSRLLRGENVLTAHRQHIYQRLCQAGWSHGSVTLLYMFLAATGTLMAVAVLLYPGSGDWTVIVALPLAAAGLWTFAKFQTTNCDDDWQPLQRIDLHTSAQQGLWWARISSERRTVTQQKSQHKTPRQRVHGRTESIQSQGDTR